MPLYADVPEVDIEQFNGSVTTLDSYSVPLSNALLSQNCSYLRGQVATRYGHSVISESTTSYAFQSMDDWLFTFLTQQYSAVVLYSSASGLWTFTSLTSSWVQLMTQTGASGAMTVPDGSRIYAAFYDATGKNGYAGAQVYGQGEGADPLFAAPLTTIPSVSQPGGGVITAGIHSIGYITTTRNGYTGVPQPVSSAGPAGSTFAPVTFTAAGGNQVTLSVNPGSWPSYLVGGTLAVVMSTVANPNRYYLVPGATAIIIAGTVSITFSITDNDLAATGEDVTTQQNLITCNTGGTPPFSPNSIFTYSSRMAYCTTDDTQQPVVYFSDQNNYQSITADQHGIYLENRDQIVHGISLRGVCYLASDTAFYAVSDNGDVPVTWTPPQLVDGSIGILAPNCLYANPSLGYALVASARGLYLFQGGVFPPLPLSYYNNQDWDRINWAAAATIKILDDQLNKRFIVVAPLDAATTPSHELTFDYTEGSEPETVKYSLNNISGYSIGSASLVFNTTTHKREVWYCPSIASAYLIRQNDGSEATPYRDVNSSGTATAINFQYETALCPRDQDNSTILHNFHGAHWRVKGSGSMTITAYSVDHQVSVTPAASPLTLATSPGQEILTRWRMTNQEQQSIQFGTNAVDNYAVISLIRVYYTETYTQRPGATS